MMDPKRESPWHNRSVEEVLAKVNSNSEGLSSEEAAKRLAVQGPNELKEEKQISAGKIFLAQFRSLIIWVLITAAVISGFLGEVVDSLAILAIVILNALMGFYQEFKAEKSIAALKKLTAPQATVLRDGKPALVSASGLVQGDILVLEAGNLVAADGRLLMAASLKCIESALTGEALAVSKDCTTLEAADLALGDRNNLVFMGTSVASGTGRAIVVATAMNTELGRIAGLIEAADAGENTPLQRKLDSFGRILLWATLGIVGLLFGLGLLRGAKPFELFMTSVSLAVAAVPEGLPAIVTVALSLGVLRMARRRSLVRKLPAVETLGSTSAICTDKTGTLTVGQMTVRQVYVNAQAFEVTGEGYGPEGGVRLQGGKDAADQTVPLGELASVLIGCNNAQLLEEDGAWKVIGDPTEGALLVGGLKIGGDRERLEQECPREREFPFDSDRKCGSVIRRMPDGGLRVFLNGAPGVVLKRCGSLYSAEGVRPLTEEDRRLILAETAAMAQQALRVLGSAYRDLGKVPPGELIQDEVEQDLIFVGLSGMYDPPRQDAKAAIATCGLAGIRVVMITGDHPDTAAAIARELGIASVQEAAVTGVELDRMSDEELGRRVSEISVYARVTAEHKLRIIRAWKGQDAVVAMTGDGVNDAPAIKGADIGIAMGQSGTEVTKQASDMIITDDNFASIVAAVEEGRGIYDNIRKTLQYLLAGNTGELLLMAICVIVGLPAPLLPIHLLWINLVTDGLPALCLATDPIDPDVMDQPPRPRSEPITDRAFLWTMGLTGLLTAGVAFAVYLFTLKRGTPELARTSAFSVLVFAELFRSFGARSESKPIWRMPFFSNPQLAAVVFLSLGLQTWIQYSPILGRLLKTSVMPLQSVLWLLAIGSIPLVVLELVKVLKGSRSRTSKIGAGT